MTLQKTAKLADIAALVGQELGVSEWFLIDQPRIDQFADATADFNSIHVDPEAARAWGLEGTIAHGFLTLSMILKLQEGLVPIPDNMTSGYNYGLEKVRFLSPVPCGKRIRGRFTLSDFREKDPGAWRYTVDTLIEIEGQEKPALSCQWLSVIYVPVN